MPKLAIGISFYNDVECLKRCLKSINWRYIHKAILIDGKYFGYDDELLVSDRETRRVAEDFKDRYPKRVLYCATDIPLPEFAKRQIYVDNAARLKADFLLILDSDEYLEVTDWPEFIDHLKLLKSAFKNDGRIFNVAMLDVHQKGYLAFRPRLWYRPEQFRYNGKHNEFVRTDGKPLNPKLIIPKFFIEIIHDPTIRTQFRQEQQRDYEYKLQELESS